MEYRQAPAVRAAVPYRLPGRWWRVAAAPVAYLLLHLAKADRGAVKSPLAFARLVRANLMRRKRIDQLTAPRIPPPEYNNQTAIQWPQTRTGHQWSKSGHDGKKAGQCCKETPDLRFAPSGVTIDASSVGLRLMEDAAPPPPRPRCAERHGPFRRPGRPEGRSGASCGAAPVVKGPGSPPERGPGQAADAPAGTTGAACRFLLMAVGVICPHSPRSCSDFLP